MWLLRRPGTDWRAKTEECVVRRFGCKPPAQTSGAGLDASHGAVHKKVLSLYKYEELRAEDEDSSENGVTCNMHRMAAGAFKHLNSSHPTVDECLNAIVPKQHT